MDEVPKSLHLDAADLQRRGSHDTYIASGRIHDGDRTTVLDHAIAAWLLDQEAGRQSLLIAADTATVTDLNIRARAHFVSKGDVAAIGVQLADGTTAGAGDRIVTRRNDRTRRVGSSWVKNGDQWTVVRGHDDGSLTVAPAANRGQVTLPADYVRDQVELGYATTAHRAQGQTVDTAHAVITGPSMTRESLYVALTRSRDANHAYVATDYTPDSEINHGPADSWTAAQVLTAILDHTGTDLSARETIQAENERSSRVQPPGFRTPENARETSPRVADIDSHKVVHRAAGVDQGRGPLSL